MPVLHIGVIETKYAANNKSVGTGDVAEILEAKYGVLGGFVTARTQDIANDLTASIRTQMRNMMMGTPTSDPFSSASQDIANRAKQYISSGEAERVLSRGAPNPVPTQAALDGKTSRTKSGKRGSRRPSFIDTGLYQGSLVSWVDG